MFNIKGIFGKIKEMLSKAFVVNLLVIGFVIISAVIMVFVIITDLNKAKEQDIKTEMANAFAPYLAPSHPNWKELVQIYDSNWNLKEEYISFGETNCYSGGFLEVFVKSGPIWIKADNIRITPIRDK